LFVFNPESGTYVIVRCKARD